MTLSAKLGPAMLGTQLLFSQSIFLHLFAFLSHSHPSFQVFQMKGSKFPANLPVQYTG